MADGLVALRSAARMELEQLLRSRVLVGLVMLEALTFLVLVSLFGLTGSRAPTALVQLDHGPLARSFVEHLEAAHHSFALRPMSLEEANRQVSRGDLVAIITIPKGFSRDVAAGRTALIPITVDNVNADLTTDIREAMPSAISAFARDNHFPGVRVAAAEHNLIGHETDYVAYLVVSALVLTAFVVAGILGAVAVTREFETRMVTGWRLAPVHPGWLLAGKLAASALVSALAVALAAAIVIIGYGVTPENAGGALAALCLCVVIFTCLGACAGALFRRSLPVAALFFGLALPFYIDSGALEPLRFDGERLWTAGHTSPVYSAIGVLQWGFHGLRVTPESLQQNVLVLALWALVSVLVASAVLARRAVPR
jgi:ABC-type transport system involved in multi-copper enzyme maturation permease subunit